MLTYESCDVTLARESIVARSLVTRLTFSSCAWPWPWPLEAAGKFVPAVRGMKLGEWARWAAAMGGRRLGDLLGMGMGIGAGDVLAATITGDGAPMLYGFGERERDGGGEEGGVTNGEEMSLTGDMIAAGGSGFQSDSSGDVGESFE